MTYRMKVVIYNPKTPAGMFSDLFFELHCNFSYDENQYGNGHYVSISAKGFNKIVGDLRYDKSFDRNNKMKWLIDWAFHYWSGENGSYKIKSLEISHA